MTKIEMTNEEARHTLKSLKEYYNDKNEDSYVGFDNEDNEALDMAIKALETSSCIKEKCAYCPHCEHCDVDDDTLEIKALEQRWIPVSERLPEKQITIGKYVFSENVLGTEGYTIRRAYYNYTTKEWFDGNEEMEWTEITHWMPLPEETPKVESEDKE